MTDLPAPLAPQTRRYNQKRDAILDAAAVLFNQKGLKGTTLAAVADSVGLMTNSVTYYYRKKEELATAGLLRSIASLQGLADTAAAEATPEARIRRLFQLFYERAAAILRGTSPPQMNFSDVRALTSPHVETVFGAYTGMFRRIRTLLAEDETHRPPRVDANARAHLVLSALNWTRVFIDRYDPDSYPRVAERIADMLIEGLAAPGSTWRDRRLPGLAWSFTDDPAREAFLRSATRLINEQGYRGASVEKISAQLNVTKGSFYHHNETKDDLVAQCFARSYAVVRRVQGLAEQAGATGWERTCLASAELVRYQLSEAGPLLRHSAFAALPEHLHDQVRQTMDWLAEGFAGMVVDGMMDGSIRPLDSAIAAQLINNMVNAAAELPWWIPGVTVENAAEAYARPLFVGLFR